MSSFNPELVYLEAMGRAAVDGDLPATPDPIIEQRESRGVVPEWDAHVDRVNGLHAIAHSYLADWADLRHSLAIGDDEHALNLTRADIDTDRRELLSVLDTMREATQEEQPINSPARVPKRELPVVEGMLEMLGARVDETLSAIRSGADADLALSRLDSEMKLMGEWTEALRSSVIDTSRGLVAV